MDTAWTKWKNNKDKKDKLSWGILIQCTKIRVDRLPHAWRLAAAENMDDLI